MSAYSPVHIYQLPIAYACVSVYCHCRTIDDSESKGKYVLSRGATVVTNISIIRNCCAEPSFSIHAKITSDTRNIPTTPTTPTTRNNNLNNPEFVKYSKQIHLSIFLCVWKKAKKETTRT